MDVRIEKKKGIKKKHIPYILLGGFVIWITGWLIFGNHSSKLSVEKQRLNIHTVVAGEFNDYVRINAQVQPINTILLSATEGGRVEEILIEEGSVVQKGDIILRMSNQNLNLSILNSEAQLAEKENFLRNTQIAMEREKLNLRKERLQLDMEVGRKKRKYGQYEKLYKEQLISREEYLYAKEDYEYAVSGRELVIERQGQDSVYRSIEIKQLEESLNVIRKNLLMGRQRVEDLNVKAPIDGQLGLLDVEIGQSVGTGGRMGQISVLSDFKVEASIDEHYIDRVKQGLSATFERQDREFALLVRKVYPEVRGQKFKTDFIFEGERPDNIRAGQTYYVNLQLGQPVEAILIPRGSFYQNTGGKWIFVLTPDESRAVKREIMIGRQNPNYYEIISGLEPGEQVIVSGYEYYGEAEELVLK